MKCIFCHWFLFYYGLMIKNTTFHENIYFLKISDFVGILLPCHGNQAMDPQLRKNDLFCAKDISRTKVHTFSEKDLWIYGWIYLFVLNLKNLNKIVFPTRKKHFSLIMMSLFVTSAHICPLTTTQKVIIQIFEVQNKTIP